MLINSSDKQWRAAAIAYPRIWRKIYLQWPADVVELYFQRSNARNILLYLDTAQTEEEDLQKIDSNRRRWADFLISNMEAIAFFRLSVRSTACSQALSSALETPAANIRTFILELDNWRLESFRNIFSNKAPKLRDIRLDTCLQWNLIPFPSLSALSLRLCRENCKYTLMSLRSLAQVEKLTLIGGDQDTDVPKIRKPSSIILPSCRQLTIQKMGSVLVTRLLRALRSPVLEHLHIRESIMLDEGNEFVPTTMAQAFASVTGPRTSPLSLFIAVHPNRVIMVTDGTPSYSYICRWHDRSDTVALGDPRVLDAVAIIFTSLIMSLGQQPTRLAIHNNVREDQELSSEDEDERQPTLLTSMDIPLLWRRVFDAYPDVETLELSGSIADGVKVLREAEHLLPRLSSVYTKPDVPTAIAQTLHDIQQSRNLALHTSHLALQPPEVIE